MFASLVICTVLIYLLGRRAGQLSKGDSAFVALFALVYPSYQVSAEITCSTYSVTFAFFLSAALLAFRAELKNGMNHVLLRLGSLLLFWLSFSMNSLLALYGGFLLLLVIDVTRRIASPVLPLLCRYLSRHLDYILLPIAYWWIVPKIYPPSGLYTGYNGIIWSLSTWILCYRRFFENAIGAQWGHAWRNAVEEPWVGIIALVVATAGYFFSRGQVKTPASVRRSYLPAMIFGVVLLLLAIFPYAAVGKSPWEDGYLSRHAILVPLPMAVIIVSFFGFSCSGRSRNIRSVGYALLACFIWLFTFSTWNYYVGWQARWVKDAALITQLRCIRTERDTSIYWITDGMPVGAEITYDFYEWSGIFRSAWGDESHLGLDLKGYDRSFLRTGEPYFNERYLLSGFNPKGKQARMIILPGPAAGSEWRMAYQYWKYRFIEPEKMTDYLKKVVSIKITRQGEYYKEKVL